MGVLDKKSSNPMFKEAVLKRLDGIDSGTMSVNGTITKTIWLLLITVVTAACSWQFMLSMGSALYPVLFISLIAGVILFYYTIKNPNNAHITAPIYAVIEGLFVGVVTAIFGSMYDGIVANAIILTFATMGMMILIYVTKIIKVTEKFKAIMTMAIGAIFILYMATWVLGFFGVSLPFMHDSSPLGIGLNIAIIVIAALSFLLDFDMIDKNIQARAPKKMEWIGSMALLATIVWLYIEFLRLLARLND